MIFIAHSLLWAKVKNSIRYLMRPMPAIMENAPIGFSGCNHFGLLGIRTANLAFIAPGITF
jgi:hypothetical protein